MKPVKHLLTLGLALGAAGLLSCSTPKPECQAAASNVNGAGLSGLAAFATRFVLVSGMGPCAELQGEVIGMQVYHPASADDPKVRDLGQTSIAIRTLSHGELFWMKEDFELDTSADTPNAIGQFGDITPDADDYCHVDTVAEARVNFEGGTIPIDLETPCMMDAECDMVAPGAVCLPLDPMDPMAGNTCIYNDVYEPTNLAYRWSNVQFYVTAAAAGTQFTADVEVELNGCTATYKAIGMWPAVDCTGITARDADGEPTAVEPLLEYCHPKPDPTNQMNPRPYGSGINPDFGPVVCDPNFAPVPVVNQYYGGGLSIPRCVLEHDDIPSLEGFTPDPAPQFP
jgi:hypothetical protein